METTLKFCLSFVTLVQQVRQVQQDLQVLLQQLLVLRAQQAIRDQQDLQVAKV